MKNIKGDKWERELEERFGNLDGWASPLDLSEKVKRLARGCCGLLEISSHDHGSEWRITSYATGARSTPIIAPTFEEAVDRAIEFFYDRH